LVGAGGIGKTRLAAEFAASLSAQGFSDAFPDGMRWISVSTVPDPRQLAGVVAEAVGLHHVGGVDVAPVIASFLADSRMLLVLDGCEELASDCQQLAVALLGDCPHLVILATSRVPLRAANEQLVPVPPLAALPGPGTVWTEAAELFCDRAGTVMPVAPGRGADPQVVNDLCQRLGGLPLAIELAAPQIRRQSAADLLSDIELNLPMLSTTNGVTEAGRNSLWALLDTIWDRLPADQQRMLSGLGAFVAEFSREAAEAVAGATLTGLAAFTEQFLIYRVPAADDVTQYGMHDLIRSYSRQMLHNQPAHATTVRWRHLDYYLSLAECAGQSGEPWPGRRHGDANFSTALAWGLGEERAEPVLRLLAALLPDWTDNSLPAQSLALLEQALALPWDPSSPTTAAARARTLTAAGHAASEHGDINRVSDCFTEAIALCKGLGDTEGYARSLRQFGLALEQAGNGVSAVRQYRNSLVTCLRAGDAQGAAWSTFHLLSAGCANGQDERVVRRLPSLIHEFDHLGVRNGTYHAYVLLGHSHRRLRKPLDALNAYAQALALQRRWHYLSQGAEILDGLALIAVDLGRPARAAVLFGASQAWADRFGHSPVALAGSSRAATGELGGERFSAELTTRRRWHREQMIDEAETAVQELSALCRQPLRGGLTTREVEVIRLVAEGLTNTEVACRLGLSPRTVHAHLRSIFDKLDVGSRTAAVHRAHDLRLI
jgi:predicted ATPase/DNA-binding CsgD family transcriptional regulator